MGNCSFDILLPQNYSPRDAHFFWEWASENVKQTQGSFKCLLLIWHRNRIFLKEYLKIMPRGFSYVSFSLLFPPWTPHYREAGTTDDHDNDTLNCVTMRTTWCWWCKDIGMSQRARAQGQKWWKPSCRGARKLERWVECSTPGEKYSLLSLVL